MSDTLTQCNDIPLRGAVLPGFSDDIFVFESEKYAAARYLLLQRLAPAIRHDFLGALQAPEFMLATLEQRLNCVSPDLNNIREDLALMRHAIQTALSSSMNVISWVKPDAKLSGDLGEVVLDCMAMMASALRIKGFHLINEVTAVDARVSVTAVRHVLSAALIALSDHSQAPATLHVEGQATLHQVELSIFCSPAEKEPILFSKIPLHPLGWQVVELLAMAESVALTRTPTGARLIFDQAA